MESYSNQEVDMKLKAHGEIIADLKSKIESMIKQQEELTEVLATMIVDQTDRSSRMKQSIETLQRSSDETMHVTAMEPEISNAASKLEVNSSVFPNEIDYVSDNEGKFASHMPISTKIPYDLKVFDEMPKRTRPKMNELLACESKQIDKVETKDSDDLKISMINHKKVRCLGVDLIDIKMFEWKPGWQSCCIDYLRKVQHNSNIISVVQYDYNEYVVGSSMSVTILGLEERVTYILKATKADVEQGMILCNAIFDQKIGDVEPYQLILSIMTALDFWYTFLQWYANVQWRLGCHMLEHIQAYCSDSTCYEFKQFRTENHTVLIQGVVLGNAITSSYVCTSSITNRMIHSWIITLKTGGINDVYSLDAFTGSVKINLIVRWLIKLCSIQRSLQFSATIKEMAKEIGTVFYDVLNLCLQPVLAMDEGCFNMKVFAWLKWKYKVLVGKCLCSSFRWCIKGLWYTIELRGLWYSTEFKYDGLVCELKGIGNNNSLICTTEGWVESVDLQQIMAKFTAGHVDLQQSIANFTDGQEVTHFSWDGHLLKRKVGLVGHNVDSLRHEMVKLYHVFVASIKAYLAVHIIVGVASKIIPKLIDALNFSKQKIMSTVMFDNYNNGYICGALEPFYVASTLHPQEHLMQEVSFGAQVISGQQHQLINEVKRCYRVTFQVLLLWKVHPPDDTSWKYTNKFELRFSHSF